MFFCRFIKALALVAIISNLIVSSAIAEMLQQSAQLKAGWYSPDAKHFHDGTGLDFSYSVKPIPYAAVEAGLGYYRAEKGATGFLSAIPLTLSARAILPLPFISLHAGGGIGSYYKMAQLDLPDTSQSTELSADHSGSSFGYHANAGLEFDSSTGLSLLFEYKHVVVNQGRFRAYDDIKHGGDFYYGGFALNF